MKEWIWRVLARFIRRRRRPKSPVWIIWNGPKLAADEPKHLVILEPQYLALLRARGATVPEVFRPNPDSEEAFATCRHG